MSASNVVEYESFVLFWGEPFSKRKPKQKRENKFDYLMLRKKSAYDMTYEQEAKTDVINKTENVLLILVFFVYVTFAYS